MVTPRTPATQAPRHSGVDSSDESSEETRGLTIGDLAQRTGVAPATLRMWEPGTASRARSAATAATAGTTSATWSWSSRCSGAGTAGLRLEVAIAGVVLAEASAGAAPGAPSVFATLRRLHPTLQPQRLRKSTLLALSWAIEDECCARAETPDALRRLPEGAVLPGRRGALDRAGPRRPLDHGLRRSSSDSPAPVRAARRSSTSPTTPPCAASGRWSATPPTTPRC